MLHLIRPTVFFAVVAMLTSTGCDSATTSCSNSSDCSIGEQCIEGSCQAEVSDASKTDVSATDAGPDVTIDPMDAGSGDATVDGGLATGCRPSAWSCADIGDPGSLGTCSDLNGELHVAGSGADIWDEADSFTYAYSSHAGDLDASVELVSFDGTSGFAKVGLMVRASLAADSAHAMMNATPNNGFWFTRRATNGGATTSTEGAQGLPGWVRMTRAGDVFTAFESADGISWVEVGSATIPMPVDVFVGVAVLSQTPGTNANAVIGAANFCAPGTCGDGVRDGAETCDDGNLVDCDGCSATCAVEVVQNFYADGDNDGYGSGAAVSALCPSATAPVTNDDDCDDGKTGVHPGAVEICDDTIDQNCSGSDAVCACVGGLTDTLTHAIPPMARPAYLQSYIDPVFGTRVTRVTGTPGGAIPIIGGNWRSPDPGHGYSKRGAWNADGSLLHIIFDTFLDGRTYEPLFHFNPPGAWRWHPTDPNKIINVLPNGTVGTLNPRTGATLTSFPFAGYSDASIGLGEGNPTLDGNWIAVTAEGPSGGVIFAVNVETGQRYPDISMEGVGTAVNGDVGGIDWASISPLGNYILVDSGGSPAPNLVYDLMGNLLITESVERLGHADLTLDNLGREVLVGISSGIGMMDLVGGTVTNFTPNNYFASHTSTRNVALMGWAFVTGKSPASNGPYYGEIVMHSLESPTVIRRLAHHRSSQADYNVQAHGAPSPDGTRVIFQSDWGDGGTPGEIAAYVVEVCP